MAIVRHKHLYGYLLYCLIMSEFHTGIQPLDRELPDGIPEGSLLVLKARPDTQSELVLQTFANNSDTVYITTHRDKPIVEDRLEKSPYLTSMPHVIAIDPSSPLDDLNQKVHSFPEECYVIIDSIDLVEDLDLDRYRNFLNDLHNHLSNTDSVGIIHAYKYPNENQIPPSNRFLTEGIADIVFNLVFSEESGDVETKLIVSKFRSGKALDEAIKVRLTDTVQVDTSRDI